MKDVENLFPMFIAKLLGEYALPKWLLAATIAIWEYLVPSIEPVMLFSAVGLLVADTITALIAVKLNKEKIESAKFIRFLTKSFSFAIAIIVIAFATHAIPVDPENAAALRVMQELAVKALIAAICINETISISENLEKAGFTQHKDIFAKLIDVLKNNSKKER